MNAKQKVLLGTLITVFFSILIIAFTIMLLYAIFSDAQFSGNKSEDIFTFLFPIGLSYFPLNYGLKLRKRGLNEATTSNLLVDSETMLEFNTHISYSDYKKLVLALNFRNSLIVFISFLGLIFLLSIIPNPQDNIFLGLIGILFLCIPFYGIIRASQAFKTNKTLHEKNNFKINTERITIHGETFNSTLSWDSFYKVLELKEWLLLYTSKNALIPIPKNQIATNDFQTLKNIVSSKSQILKELK